MSSIFTMWMPKISIISVRASQPQCYRHLGSNNSLLGGWGEGGDCLVHCRTFSSISGPYPLDGGGTSSASCDNQKCHQTSPNIPWGTKSHPPHHENHWIQGSEVGFPGPLHPHLGGLSLQWFSLFFLQKADLIGSFVCLTHPAVTTSSLPTLGDPK